MAYNLETIGLATLLASVVGLVAFAVAEGVRILVHRHNEWTVWSEIPLSVYVAVEVIILAATIPTYGLDGFIGALTATPVVIVGGRIVDQFVGDTYETRL